MKHLNYIPLFVAMCLLTACSAPTESFFYGKWEAIAYFVNAEDQLPVNNITLAFDEEGKFEQTVVTHGQERNDAGTWEFEKDAKKFRMIYERNNQVVTWDLLEQGGDTFKMKNEEYPGFYVEWKFKRVN